VSFLSKLVENDAANVPLVNAELHNIIRADFAKNHVGREYTVEMAIAGFNAYKAGGGLFMANDKTIIIYKMVGDDSVEFHCSNGATGAELAQFVCTFLSEMSKSHKYACTYYDNERVSELMAFSNFRCSVERIDGGLDRTFRATFNLLEAA